MWTNVRYIKYRCGQETTFTPAYAGSDWKEDRPLEKSDVMKITEVLEAAGYDVQAIENEVEHVLTSGVSKPTPNGIIKIKVMRRGNED